jgi:hypothetical protein
METKAPSARQQIAERLAEFVSHNRMAEIFGGDVTLSKDKRYYNVLFSRARTLDGGIRVYSPKFIQIGWQTMYQTVGARGSVVVESVDAAEQWLKAAFVDFDEDALAKVPVKSK